MAGRPTIDWSRPIANDGLCLTVEQWAVRKGLSTASLKNRIRTMGVDKALSKRVMSSSEAGRRGSSTWRRVYVTARLAAATAGG